MQKSGMIPDSQSNEKEIFEAKLGDIVKIFSAVSNEDAMKIFYAAKNGIQYSTKTIRELGLTQKKYYTRLKELLEAGLIRKDQGLYTYTLLGEVCYKLGKEFLRALNKKEELKIAENILKFDQSKNKSISQLIETMGVSEIIYDAKMFTHLDGFIKETIDSLNKSRSTVYMAVGRTDLRVTESVINAIDRGVKVFLVSTERVYKETSNVLKIILNPNIIKLGLKLIRSNDLNFRITKTLRYSFVIVDSEFGIIELPHPFSEDFFVAFKFNNSTFCKELENEYWKIYEKAIDDSRIENAKKFLSLYKDTST